MRALESHERHESNTLNTGGGCFLLHQPMGMSPGDWFHTLWSSLRGGKTRRDQERALAGEAAQIGASAKEGKASDGGTIFRRSSSVISFGRRGGVYGGVDDSGRAILSCQGGERGASLSRGRNDIRKHYRVDATILRNGPTSGCNDSPVRLQTGRAADKWGEYFFPPGRSNQALGVRRR